MHELSISPDDMTTILASMIRSTLSSRTGSNYLPTAPIEIGEATPLSTDHLGLDDSGLMDIATQFTSMFGLSASMDSFTSSPTLGEWTRKAFSRWQTNNETIYFNTSGSTGTPTTCPQAMALLEQEILAQAEIFKGCTRILTFVPRHHIYGFLFSVLLPKVLQVPVLDLAPIVSTGLLAKMAKGDLVIAFPLFWKALSQLNVTFPQGVRGVTSTGPCPATTIQQLLGHGLTMMTEVYGSSETGGLGTRNHPEDPYTLLPFWKVPPDHDEKSAQIDRILRDGRTTTSYTMPDVVQWEDARTFRPIKRMDKAVQVAGINVYPDRIAHVIKTHPEIKDCAVRLMRPEEGHRLKAFIIPKSDMSSKEERRKLRSWIAAHLASAEIPKSLTFGTKLPVNAMGKHADWDSRQ
jgi:4-coumarate--CoA ligase (photoactive yellow protein activation family)